MFSNYPVDSNHEEKLVSWGSWITLNFVYCCILRVDLFPPLCVYSQRQMQVVWVFLLLCDVLFVVILPHNCPALCIVFLETCPTDREGKNMNSENKYVLTTGRAIELLPEWTGTVYTDSPAVPWTRQTTTILKPKATDALKLKGCVTKKEKQNVSDYLVKTEVTSRQCQLNIRATTRQWYAIL